MRARLTRRPVDARGEDTALRLRPLGAAVAARRWPSRSMGASGGAAPPVPLNKVSRTRSRTRSATTAAPRSRRSSRATNPARAGTLKNKSTIVATQQVGRVYDGGASDIGYEVSVNGGQIVEARASCR